MEKITCIVLRFLKSPRVRFLYPTLMLAMTVWAFGNRTAYIETKRQLGIKEAELSVLEKNIASKAEDSLSAKDVVSLVRDLDTKKQGEVAGVANDLIEADLQASDASTPIDLGLTKGIVTPIKISSGKIQMYLDKNEKGTIVGYLGQGKQYSYTDYSDGWYFVVQPNVSGWVRSEDVTLLQ